MLVKQYIRAIVELQPKAFVMENVSMLKSDVHRFYMEKTDTEDVEQFSIPVKKLKSICLTRNTCSMVQKCLLQMLEKSRKIYGPTCCIPC